VLKERAVAKNGISPALTTNFSFSNGPLPTTTFPFVIPSEAEGSAVRRTSPGNDDPSGWLDPSLLDVRIAGSVELLHLVGAERDIQGRNILL
jgi:hypothetical protein